VAFFFSAFSIDWWTTGDLLSKAVVGSVTLLVFVMIANSIIHTKERDLWWPTKLELLSYLANACKRGVEVMRIKRARRNDGDIPEIELAPMGIPTIPLQADAAVDTPRNPSSSTNSPTTHAAIASPPHQLDGGNIMLLSPQWRTDLSFVSGVGSSEHDGRTAADSCAPILADPRESEGLNYTENMVEEPQQLDIAQAQESTRSLPMITVKRPTGDAQMTLQCGDIGEY